MKRAYRKTHVLMWLILAPLMIATLVIAIMVRPDEPTNDRLPNSLLGNLIEEAE
ncbi:MAG: hypothetical protein AAFZ91_05680 [Pseudomonadota bacterium]